MLAEETFTASAHTELLDSPHNTLPYTFPADIIAPALGIVFHKALVAVSSGL